MQVWFPSDCWSSGGKATAMIDIHCHVLPGLDDGPGSLAETMALCRAARASATHQIAATPHVNWSYPLVSPASVHAAVREVNLALQAAGIDLLVVPGAEISLSRAAELRDGDLGVLKLGAGRHLLVECPRSGAGFEGALARLGERGYRVVLAHPERSELFQRRPELVRRLVAGGALMCGSAGSLNGANGREARAYAWKMLEEGLVHALASDGHDTVWRRPDLVGELERAGLDAEEIDHYAEISPGAILSGTPIPPPRPVRRRRFGSRARRRGGAAPWPVS